jgi:cell division protein FtsB
MNRSLRVRSRGRRGAGEVWEGSDARPARRGDARGGGDGPASRGERLRRGVGAAVLLGIFVVGCLTAVVGERGGLELWRTRREATELAASLRAQRAELARLEEEVTRLQRDPLALERLAREELGLVLPGEVDFLLPVAAAPRPSEAATTPSARAPQR